MTFWLVAPFINRFRSRSRHFRSQTGNPKAECIVKSAMESNSTSQRSFRKKAVLTSIAILLVALFAWAWTASQKNNRSAKLPTPEEAKEILTDYLKEKSGHSTFSSSIEVTKESL